MTFALLLPERAFINAKQRNKDSLKSFSMTNTKAWRNRNVAGIAVHKNEPA